MKFQDNKKMAELRLHNLKKRFKRERKLHEDYTNFMQDMISKGLAEVQDKRKCHPGKIWYNPDHAVYHPSKPGKIRVVFDCSAEWHGVSINKSLMSGPDLTNKIIGVLAKFRGDPVVVMADIQAVFYQVFVSEKHRSLLSFLWWEDDNYNEAAVTYHTNVHVFVEYHHQAAAIMPCEELLLIMKSNMDQKFQKFLETIFMWMTC